MKKNYLYYVSLKLKTIDNVNVEIGKAEIDDQGNCIFEDQLYSKTNYKFVEIISEEDCITIYDNNNMMTFRKFEIEDYNKKIEIFEKDDKFLLKLEFSKNKDNRILYEFYLIDKDLLQKYLK
jgi:hypothetical protein